MMKRKGRMRGKDEIHHPLHRGLFQGKKGGGGRGRMPSLANMQMDNNTEEKIGQPPKKRGNGQKRGRKEGRGRGRKKRMKKRKRRNMMRRMSDDVDDWRVE